MYQIRCDDYILYDPREPELTVLNPRCKLEVNTVAEGSFTILETHPHYDKLQKLKSVFEIRQDGQPIFRGRMTNDSRDFYNRLKVDLEGVLAFTNDSIIEPFNFPNDFPDASAAENMVEYFLGWILEQHNSQVEEQKQLKLGNVTVADKNNYITRESNDYATTWETLKSKLFESSLGGYLLIRYEDDGNYVDYVDKFELTNVQPITLGKNLLDLTTQSDATSTFSAILPIGGEVGNGGSSTNTKRLTLEDLPDGDLTDDLVKMGKYIYSKSAKEQYGWICVPPDESVWDDITQAENLKTTAMEYLTGNAMLFSGLTTIRAVDLSFTDEQIQSFRIYRNILVNSPAHGIKDQSYQLTKLDIDILNPQNTTITLDEPIRSLIDINRIQLSNQNIQAEKVKNEVKQSKVQISEMQQQLTTQNTQIISECNEIILSALESYVETSNFEQYKETVSAQLQILVDQINMNFTTVTDHIVSVDDDLQRKVSTIYKNINFSDDGITIGAGENAIKMNLDNDQLVFSKAGLEIVRLDINNFTPTNIYVRPGGRVRLGDFAFDIPEEGGLLFGKVGG